MNVVIRYRLVCRGWRCGVPIEDLILFDVAIVCTIVISYKSLPRLSDFGNKKTQRHCLLLGTLFFQFHLYIK